MEIIDFEFKRERKLGEFIQDFINLLKIIYRHLVSVLFQLLAIPISGIVLMGYYLTTQLSANADYSSGEYVRLIVLCVILALGILLISLFAFGFSIEYFILLRDKRTLDFSSKDVFKSFTSAIKKYLSFFGAMLVVGVLISVPVALAMLLSALIPFVGSFAIGIVFSIVGLWFFSAFMLYREGYADLMDCFGAGFSLIKKKIIEYGAASYIVSFIFQSLMGVMTIIPAVIIFLIGYNFVGFNNDFFESGIGKAIGTIGGLVVTILFIVYYMLAVISYGIIYETAKELRYGENIFDRIGRLGRGANA